MSRRAMRLRAAAATAALLVLPGCGAGESAPVDEQPRLAALLTDVDGSITAGRYLQARQSLDLLVEATASARRTGAVDDEAAARVLAAAAQLRTQLSESMQERRAATEEPTPPDEHGDEGSGGGGNDNGHGKPDKPHKPDKPKGDKSDRH